MKHKIITIVCTLMLISLASAWNVTTFNNSLSEENLTFTGGDTFIRWLSISEDIEVITGSLRLTGYPTGDLESSGLKQYYKLDETSGTNALDEMSLYNGTANNADIFTAGSLGILGTSARFVGSRVINIGDIAWVDDTDSLTVSLWVNFTDLTPGGQQFLFSKSDGIGPDDNVFSMRIQTSGYLNFYMRDVNNIDDGIIINASDFFTTNELYHIVATANSTTIQIYVNGTLANSTARAGGDTFNPNSKSLAFGRFGSWNGYFFVGDLDEVGLWNRSLSASEVEELYNSGNGLSFESYEGNYASYPDSPTLFIPPVYPAYYNTFEADNENFTFYDGAVIDSAWSTRGLNSLNITGDAGGNAYGESDTLNFSEVNYIMLDYNLTHNKEGALFTIYNISGLQSEIVDTINANGSATDYLINVSDITYDEGYLMVGVDNCFGACTGAYTHLFVDNIIYSQEDPSNYAYYYNGSLTGSATTTDLQDEISYYLTTCTYVSGYCDVPFEFFSSSPGILKYSNINVNNSGVLIFAIGYEPTVTETENVYFDMDFNYDSINNYDPQVFLVYDGVEYKATTNDTGDYVKYYTTISIPLVDADENKTFYWRVDNVGGTYYSPNYTQLVYDLPLISVNTTCGALTPIIHFNFSNEENFTTMNASVDYNFKYGISNDTALKYYGEFSNIDEFYICINDSVSDTYSFGYGEIQYTFDGFEGRRYYLFEGASYSNNTVVNYTLYHLLDTSGTLFELTFTDKSLNPYNDNYITLNRWYPNLDEYLVVDMGKTDENGETLTHLVLNDVDYRLALYQADGTLIKLMDPRRFSCAVAPCTFALRVEEQELDLSDFHNVQTDLSYNSTSQVFTLIYNDPSQTTSGFRLYVVRQSGNQSDLVICNKTVTSFSGVVTCDTSAYTGVKKAIVYRTASPEIPVTQKVVNTLIEFDSTFALFISAFLWIAMILIGIAVSPLFAIILGIVGLIPAVLLGAINIAVFTGVVILFIIVIHFIKRAVS